MKQKFIILLQGFLVAVALTSEFHIPLVLESYESRKDYFIASIYELLGTYNFQFVLFWILASAFFMLFKEKVKSKENTSIGLSLFFSLSIVFGKSYFETDSSVYVLGSIVNFIKSLFTVAGYTCLIYVLLAVLFDLLKNTNFMDKNTLCTKRSFWISFLVLSVVYGTVILLSYPGTLCWDVIGQIEQVTKESGYSAHHPLMHTILVGGLVKLGNVLFHSYEVGLFLYMLLQMVMLVTAMSSTILVLKKRGLKDIYLRILLILYCITPLYSNIVSVAIKDVPYSAFVVGYVIMLAELLENPKIIVNKGFVYRFILVQLGTILMRNNGLQLIVISGLVAFVYLFKKYNWKQRLVYLLAGIGASVIVGKVIVIILTQLTMATAGSSGEILSLPFQQTARYLQLYQDEITEEEKTAIEAVLGPVSVVAAEYNPKIADDVKALFIKDASTEEIMNYLLCWGKGFFKHPGVYLEAFFIHVYGWFSPVATNAIRYETTYTDIAQDGLFYGAGKGLIFLYRFANRMPVLGILENVGAYVWGLFFFVFYMRKLKQNEMIFASVPLFVSLLICMASPCFLYHPRYGMPIIMSLPFLYGFALTSKQKVEV